MYYDETIQYSVTCHPELLEKDILLHYGTPRHSGRYPWGSGENPYQRTKWFVGRVNELKAEGLSETAIAEYMGLKNTGELRKKYSAEKSMMKIWDADRASSLKADGKSNREIAEIMGYKNESSIRSLLDEKTRANNEKAYATAQVLKTMVDEKGMLDVGSGAELSLGVSRTKLDTALYMLKSEGYEVYGRGVRQVTNPGQQTIIKVLCKPGTEHSAIYEDASKIGSVMDYVSYDGGDTYKKGFMYPKSMDSSRLAIRYAEDGGKEKDGVIELRRGVADLDLGESHYAQVRILVDGNRYLKGMAIYSDNMPDGVDVVFNTNKSKDVAKLDVLKKISDDPDNPFGSLIKEHGGQSTYIDKNGNEQLSLINKRAEEGDWGSWSKKLPSQFLAKQNLALVNKQLNLSVADKVSELEEINALTNPTLRKMFLEKFAESCDHTAVHLDAAALPGQRYQVILPITSMKDTEVYAPNYADGTKVALIRFPHGGTFEIPILTVNNKQKEAKSLLGNTLDAVGISSAVAERLSGADFDGDTVMVIPDNNKIKITSTNQLEGLKDFDPKSEYPERPGMKVMTNTQTEMGKISNLITDMTVQGASSDELARAVRHSMVVIDAEKHHLDYKRSEEVNGITALKKSYQPKADGGYGGASTILSRAKGEQRVNKRVGSPDREELRTTGKLKYKEVEETYIDKNGKPQTRQYKSTQMAETDDAMTLVSPVRSPVELAYADYANRMKSMANEARKAAATTKGVEYSPEAKKKHQAQVDSLNIKLNESKKNHYLERQAQLLANSTVDAKLKDNPGMTTEQRKKENQRAITSARLIVGSKRNPIVIDDLEWEAIQSGAISNSKLTEIFNNSDIDSLRERAMPKASTQLSSAQIARIKAMENSGYTSAQIAEALSISTSTVAKYLR